MSVYFCIPSARPSAEVEPVLRKWRDRGYKIAIQYDSGRAVDHPEWFFAAGNVAHFRPYQGYADAVNFLAHHVLACDPSCSWIVTGGDDTEPDPNHTADEIAAQCETHFYGAVECAYPPSRPAWTEIPIPSPGGIGSDAPSWKRWSTFGVMQPTGDVWGEDDQWAIQHFPVGQRRFIERVAGSPWLGREFCRRMYGGRGPLWPGWIHMRVDEELQCVAKKLKVFWQRPDLIHMHHHFLRRGAAIPPHLTFAAGKQHWDESTALFRERQSKGFPGHEPIP